MARCADFRGAFAAWPGTHALHFGRPPAHNRADVPGRVRTAFACPRPAERSGGVLLSTLQRLLELLLRPAAAWERIAAAPEGVDALLRRVILPYALLAPIATGIGMSVFDARWDPLHGYLVAPDRIFATAATTYFTIVASILVLAAIFVRVAPAFGASASYRAALNVAAFGALPVLVAGATMLLPVMAIVGLLALCHTLFLYWLGARHVLGVAAGDLSEFVGISLLLLSAISVIAGAAASSIGLL